MTHEVSGCCSQISNIRRSNAHIPVVFTPVVQIREFAISKMRKVTAQILFTIYLMYKIYHQTVFRMKNEVAAILPVYS